MKKLFLLALLPIFLASCGSSKHTATKTIIVNSKGKPNRTRTVEKKEDKKNIIITTTEADEVVTADSNKNKLENIIDFARSFEGTRYKFGGTTEEGMDCSGLVYTAFKKENVIMPRISRDMASKGVSVKLKEVTEGDLVFFKTSRRNSINHVGLVVENKRGEILFIHSTTSKGVIISSLEEDYWKKAFVEVRRVI
ncbi:MULTISPECIES: C40 family peptidase [Altibacter]|uniref:C40 family peptidase n=1 Tax=Altibacter TaxID=1535231 RepID=UPI000551A9EC|nr:MULTISPECIES: C40 family peptidase [Altibacter]MCW8980732.1 C40 family peptidase [Altibacter sp.]MCW9036543.1 C40 family peptidase [Altibacter sp.]